MNALHQLTRSFAIAILVCFATSTFAQTVPVVTAKRDLPASTVLDANDVEISQWDVQKTPGKSFAEVESVVGQTLINKVFANSPILKTNLVKVAEENPVSREDDRIIAIPVSISTRYEISELVRLVYQDDKGERQVIADNLKVFHIGEPDTIQGEDGKQIFIRFVSVLAPLETAEKISNSINERQGIHVLEKLNPKPVQNTDNNSTQTNTGRQPTPNTVAPPRQATNIPRNAKIYADQLRNMARLLEAQAAELEDQGRYEQADLIREACQNLREAGRVK